MRGDTAPPVRGRRAARGPRRRTLLSLLAIAACAGIALVSVTDPYAGATASSFYRQPAVAQHPAAVQRFSIDGGTVLVALKRDRFTTQVLGSSGAADVVMPSGPVAPASTAQAFAAGIVAQKGWAGSEFSCLVSLWNRESGWNAHAANPSGAYGIPQALPGSKMGVGGGDWQNDYRVQIRWGIGYIAGRYGSPCGAWAHSQAVGSY
ncbi:aggregation-promoting factor C-terminal-like domain-containing protein [Amnibacterium setariae]|uniref:Lytic transglycosylase domain-containing protein n=1 Tax=Amnibacterium setariae TaxID=2306585 RepID=A0A3A1U0J7_9MICO|nr:lytic transglycosylase domain-containing protein [Amnibacterium setariae]RIX29992.1 lytic transglycosylase domain-containing protein [Amnibacterium setariae]